MRSGQDLVQDGEIILSGDVVSDSDAVWFFETPRPAIKKSEPRDNARWLPLDTVAYAALGIVYFTNLSFYREKEDV